MQSFNTSIGGLAGRVLDIDLFHFVAKQKVFFRPTALQQVDLNPVAQLENAARVFSCLPVNGRGGFAVEVNAPRQDNAGDANDPDCRDLVGQPQRKKLMGIPDYRHLMRSARSAPLPQDEAVGLGFYGRVNPRPVVVPKSPDYCAQPVRMQPVYEAVLRQERNGMRPPRLIKGVGERRLLSEAPTGNWAANSSAHSSSKLPVTTPINGRGRVRSVRRTAQIRSAL